MIVLTEPKKAPPLTKEPHTIPRFYLNKFADANRRLWVYQQNRSGEKRSTKSLTTQPFFYEYNSRGVHTDNRIERWLGSLEDKAAKLYWKQLAASPLGEEEAMYWALFVASLFLRTRKWRRQMVEPNIPDAVRLQTAPEHIAELQYTLFKKGVFLDRADLIKRCTDIVQTARDEPAFFHLSHMPESVIKLALILRQKDWYTFKAPAGRKFISSDAPVSSFKLDHQGRIFDGHGFAIPDVAAALPLSPEKLWIASPPTFKWIDDLSTDDLETFNRLTVSFGEQMLFSRDQDDALEDLVNRHLNNTIFGVTAFRSGTAQPTPSTSAS